MVFRKGDSLPRNMNFTYDGKNIETVSKFVYSGITFSNGGSFNETHKTLSGQALKATFKLNQYYTILLNYHLSMYLNYLIN